MCLCAPLQDAQHGSGWEEKMRSPDLRGCLEQTPKKCHAWKGGCLSIANVEINILDGLSSFSASVKKQSMGVS